MQNCDGNLARDRLRRGKKAEQIDRKIERVTEKDREKKRFRDTKKRERDRDGKTD